MNLKNVFHQAEAYREAGGAEFFARGMDRNPNFALCAMVCSAFALELYLKVLISMEMKKPPRTHSLVELFGQLNDVNKQRIRTRVANMPPNRGNLALAARTGALTDFDGILMQSDKAFEYNRYFYENHGKRGGGWMANDILDATRLRILELQPTWKI